MSENTEPEGTEAISFYREAITLLNKHEIPFMIGGGMAMFHYTGIARQTKDIDVFCKSSTYPAILKMFSQEGFETELTDVRWLAKVFRHPHYMDIIFNTVNNICVVDDLWLTHAQPGLYEGIPVQFVPAEELAWCKIFVQNRERFDGADVNHLLLKQGKNFDWQRLLMRLDHHWHLLLAQLIIFQFVYPADFMSIIPKWLFDELMTRANDQYLLPTPQELVCRGPIIDQTQYQVDIKEWNY